MPGASQIGQYLAPLGVFFKVAPDYEECGANAVAGKQVGQPGQTAAQDNMPDLVRRAAGQRVDAEIALDRIEVDGHGNDGAG